MVFFDKKSYIDQYILSARIGKKESYEHLRLMYDFLLEDIYNSFRIVYPFLKDKKFDVFHEFYILFWNAIHTYDFKKTPSFSVHLQDILIVGIQDHLSNYFSFDKKTIASKELIKKLIIKKPPLNHRYFALRAFKFITAKQKQALSLHIYKGLTEQKSRNLLGINLNAMNKRVSFAYKAIYKNLNKVKIGKKTVNKYREKTHRVRVFKIPETEK